MKSPQIPFYSRRFSFVFLIAALLLLGGCDIWGKLGKKEVVLPEKKRPAVSVMTPMERMVTDYEEFTGKTVAVDEVELRAQVSGFLKKCDFVEGAEVHRDELLFEIEPEVYQAVRDGAQGALDSLRARLPQLENESKRLESLQDRGAASKSEYEKTLADRDECKAKIKEAEAKLMQADINLKYTKILSPIDGCISRELVTAGNLVQAHSTSNSTLLAQIVSLDPIYLYFYVDEGTYLLMDKAAQEKYEADPSQNRPETQVDFRLSNENDYLDESMKPLHSGVIQYADPFMDNASGTLLMRATCPNPKRANGTRALKPGMVVHVRIPIVQNYSALLIPEEAIGTDQGIRYVYVLDTQNQAQMRHLELGPLQSDNMRVVRKGLSKGDVVIVDGLLRIRPGVQVNPTETTPEKLREGITSDNEKAEGADEKKQESGQENKDENDEMTLSDGESQEEGESQENEESREK